ncbi:MAG: PqqD family protein [Candidatus Binatia bacterium]
MTPRHKSGYESADLDGEFMLYHSAEAKALYLNETASLIWKLCDGQRSIEAIESILRDAYPEAPELRQDLDEVFRVLLEQGVVEVP